MAREGRLSAIRRLVGSRKVRSQDELLAILRSEGHRITQATLSRDLKALKVGKVPDDRGGYVYAFSDAEGKTGSEESLVQDFLRGFISVEFSGQFGLIKTLPGHAGSVAYALDHMALPSVLGTVAGDDTILIVPRDGSGREEILGQMRSRIPGI